MTVALMMRRVELEVVLSSFCQHKPVLGDASTPPPSPGGTGQGRNNARAYLGWEEGPR